MKKFLILGLMATFCFTQQTFGQNAQEQNAVNDSINNIIELAKKGDANAQNIVGSWYYRGEHVQQDYKQALQMFARSAQQGNVQAIGNMGMCYQTGNGIEKDSIRAIQLYDRSIKGGNKALLTQQTRLANNGNVFSNVFMALCHQNGTGVEKNTDKAIEYFTKAAEMNSADAQRELALCYMNTRKPYEAAPWFKRGADNGDLSSTYYYGKLLHDGNGINKDEQQGFIYLLKSAEAGFTQGQFEIANCYYNGEGTVKNLEIAAQWYKKAAVKGSAGAQWSLGNCYVNGEGVERNYDEAIHWFAEAVTKGYARRFTNMCDNENDWKNSPFLTYLKGMNSYTIAKDINKAFDYFKALDKKKIAEGITMMGVCLANKDYAKQNLKKSVKTLQKAVNAQNLMAMYLLSAMYENGRGVKVDMEQAVKLMQQSADKGYATAQSALGDMYYEGRGVNQDYYKAVEYYSKANEQGQLTSNAAKRLASCYENGQGGLQVDKEKAEVILKETRKNNTPDLLKLIPIN